MRRSLAVAGAALAVTAASLQAQGSAVMTHSSCATAMGAAGVASPCRDGSAVLFNPGALAMQQSVLGAGLTGIRTGGSFTYDITGERVERDAETAQVPFAFASYRIGERWAVGIGGFNPYGLRIEWPIAFEGRFVSHATQLRNIYVQPTVAFQATPWLSVGAGLDVVRADIEINQRADLATQIVRGASGTPQLFPNGDTVRLGNLGVPSGTDFAEVQLKGNGTGVTFNVGAVARVSSKASVGVRYMHRAKIDYDGDASFSPLQTGLRLGAGNPFGVPAGAPLEAIVQSQFTGSGALVNGEISTTLTLPAQLVVGVAYNPVQSLKLLADYQWTSWSDFDQATIDFERAETPDNVLILDYDNTNTYRFGAEYAATRALALRAGFIFNTAAEKALSVSPFLPEAERNYYSLGAGYDFDNGLGIDLGYQLVKQSDRRGRVRARTNYTQTAEQLNVGVYHADANVFNVTLSYRFGPRGR